MKPIIMTSNDYQVLKMLSLVGHASRAQLHTFIGNDRISSLQEAGLIEKSKKAAYTDGIYTAAYKLTKGAEKFSRKHYKIRAFYTSNSPSHDVGLCDFYLSLSQIERDSARTEGQLKNDLMKVDGYNLIDKASVSACDMSYIRNDALFLVEIATDCYKESTIAKKELFAKFLGAELELVRV